MKKKILIIEDEKELCELLKIRFENIKLQVTIANDGEAGLKAAQKENPDLIILDLMLPKLSGEEVCKAIRKLKDEKLARVPIIMLTAKSTETDKTIGRIIGADAYIVKPFDAAELLETMGELLGQKFHP